jgi:predicted alpha/beta hydrolase family esterase
MYRAAEVDATKVMMFHAQDDPYVPYRSVQKFARVTGARLKLLRRGGHLSTDLIVRKYWARIREFFEQ